MQFGEYFSLECVSTDHSTAIPEKMRLFKKSNGLSQAKSCEEAIFEKQSLWSQWRKINVNVKTLKKPKVLFLAKLRTQIVARYSQDSAAKFFAEKNSEVIKVGLGKKNCRIPVSWIYISSKKLSYSVLVSLSIG